MILNLYLSLEKMAGKKNTDDHPDGKQAGPNGGSLPENDTTTLKETPFLYLKGFFMGSADVVPGVSGGTIALIMGIYYRFVNAIRSVDANAIKALFRFRIADVFETVHWKFLIVLLSGALSAVLFFTRVVPLPELMHTKPELIYGLFFGLILGSVFLLTYGLKSIGWKAALLIIAGTYIGYRVVTLVPAETPDNMLFIFLSGSLSISAMVLPGISGSFILLILRKYDTVLGAFAKLGGNETMDALMILVPFGFGLIFGLALFARLLSWLLNHYYTITLCILIGFMAGSLYIIWPFQEQEYVESVRTETVSIDNPVVQEIRESMPDLQASEYRKLGEVVNPDAPQSAQKIEVITVKQKLLSSSPYLPDLAGTDERLSNGRQSVIEGFAMFVFGVFIVGLIGFVSHRKSGSVTGGSVV